MRFKSKGTSTKKFLSSGDISAIYIVYLALMILGVTLSYQGYGVALRRRPPRDFAAFVGPHEGSIRMGSFANGRDGIVSK